MRTKYAAFLVIAVLLVVPLTLQLPTAAAVELKEGAQNVGILLFDDVFITEFVAPFDIYKHVGDKMNVFTVASTQDAIRTYEGVALQPDFSFANVPRIDVLVVPSGNRSTTSDLKNAKLIDFVRHTASSAQYVTSHCWGSFTLAATGLLDGRKATTFPSSIGKLHRTFPKVEAIKGKRFVEDGNIITSNGGLAAFESALFAVEKLYGAKKADEVASGLVFAPENRRLSIDPVTAMQ
jgi:transcriptional regulator GlxA family with amidase domain